MPTKLGPHCILTTDAGLRWARRAPIVKSLDRLGSLQAAQDGAILVFRHYWPDQGLVLKHGGAWAAQVVIAKLQGFHDPRLYVEGMNETCQRLGQGLEEYVVWQQQFSDYCHARGYKVAGFSFSTGCPEPEDWRYVQEHGFGGCDVLSIHEYWGTQGFTVWHALRHRQVHDWLNGQHPPMLITECGRDRVEGGKGGWQADGVTAEQYLAELVAYDRELQNDDYILGATPFTSGPTGDWWAFDMDGVSDELEGGEPMPAPEPTPEPEPEPGPPPDDDLIAKDPVLYSQWIEAGGDPHGDYRRYRWGIGADEPSDAEIEKMADDLKSEVENLKAVALRRIHPKA